MLTTANHCGHIPGIWIVIHQLILSARDNIINILYGLVSHIWSWQLLLMMVAAMQGLTSWPSYASVLHVSLCAWQPCKRVCVYIYVCVCTYEYNLTACMLGYTVFTACATHTLAYTRCWYAYTLCVQTCMWTGTNMCTHTQSHTHTHTHTHTRARVHTNVWG